MSLPYIVELRPELMLQALYGELATRSLFSMSLYMQRLISSGTVENDCGEDKVGDIEPSLALIVFRWLMWDILPTKAAVQNLRIVRDFPVIPFDQSTLNQRRVMLYSSDQQVFTLQLFYGLTASIYCVFYRYR